MKKYSGSMNKVCEDWFHDNFPFDETIYPDTPDGECEYITALNNIKNSITWDTAKQLWSETNFHEYGDWCIEDIYHTLKRISERL